MTSNWGGGEEVMPTPLNSSNLFVKYISVLIINIGKRNLFSFQIVHVVHAVPITDLEV